MPGEFVLILNVYLFILQKMSDTFSQFYFEIPKMTYG